MIHEGPVGLELVWSGRGERGPATVDGWSCDRATLRHRLADAPELIVLDALSFPWEDLRSQDWDIPMVVVLPPGMPTQAVETVFGSLVLDRLTPHDLVVWNREELRQVVLGHGLPAEVGLVVSSLSHTAVREAVAQHRENASVDIDTDFGIFRTVRQDLIAQHLQKFGSHQRSGLNVLLALVRSGEVVVDVGAHIGTFAIPLARAVGPSGRVIAIEGFPATADLLSHNVEVNGLASRVEVVERVLGDQDGVPVHSLRRPHNVGATAFTPGTPEEADATTTTLDQVWAERGLPSPSVVKVDVEGGELGVLLGGESVLSRARPVIMLEVSRALLARQGWSLGQLRAWIVDADYVCYLITGRRNAITDGWSLAYLEDIEEIGDEMVDIVVEGRESSRLREVVGAGAWSGREPGATWRGTAGVARTAIETGPS